MKLLTYGSEYNIGLKFRVQNVPASGKRLPNCGEDLPERWKQAVPDGRFKGIEAMSPTPLDIVKVFSKNNMLAAAVHTVRTMSLVSVSFQR